MDGERTCQWCGKPFLPIRQRQVWCGRKCTKRADNAFTLEARRHYRAWLKSQAVTHGATSLVEQAPDLASTIAAKAIPVGWDSKQMRNWRGKLSEADREAAQAPRYGQEPTKPQPAAITERRIKR